MLIKKILEHKTRNGLLAFLAGLIFAVIALYIDVIRGNSLGTIGLYQIVGALTGYTISGIGIVMVMKETELRKTLQTFLFYGGGLIAAISVFADYIGVTGPQGFDKFQMVGLISGLVIVVCSIFVLPQRLWNIGK